MKAFHIGERAGNFSREQVVWKIKCAKFRYLANLIGDFSWYIVILKKPTSKIETNSRINSNRKFTSHDCVFFWLWEDLQKLEVCQICNTWWECTRKVLAWSSSEMRQHKNKALYDAHLGDFCICLLFLELNLHAND